jgi:hypothetical protein
MRPPQQQAIGELWNLYTWFMGEETNKSSKLDMNHILNMMSDKLGSKPVNSADCDHNVSLYDVDDL